jgi:peptidoglycan hydrolase-like protein with peptidoglycan-binding domain
MAQALLDGLGLSPGPVDGRMGSGTAKAIRHFQLKSALPVDGQVTPALLAKLQDAYGRRLT